MITRLPKQRLPKQRLLVTGYYVVGEALDKL